MDQPQRQYEMEKVGVYIEWPDNSSSKISIPTGKYSTNYKAEAEALQEAAKWIPGHVDIFGNDVADQLAKEDGMMEQIQHNPSCNEAKTLINSALDCHWRQKHPQHNSEDAIHELSRAEQEKKKMKKKKKKKEEEEEEEKEEKKKEKEK
ncbi:hypothetical protein ElyMa_003137400 [Elysia marginata]|uniref:RNase H type-1 domain-containing protein n=1 Tax=Elysia marginata TaxID=1093978 RepID=A0AAV4ISX8_9GAST|nr:hypothetical protein ElyMa_003137400 [Elysia marginata]